MCLTWISHYFFQHFHEVDPIIIPILQTRKLRFSEVTLYAPDNAAQKVAEPDLNLCF